MEQYLGARKFGVTVILFTALFRVFELGLPQSVLRKLPDPWEPERDTSFSPGPPAENHKEKGNRDGSLFASPERTVFPLVVESAPPMEVKKLSFTEADAEGIALVNTGSQQPDLGALLATPWETRLAGKVPTVLILHTHTTESYTPGGEHYQESDAYRTLDEGYNMLSIGDRLAQQLEAGGVHVVHDRELHDYPSYTGAYNHARKAIQASLKEHPTIRLVLDLHRDAAESGSGQYRTEAKVGSQTSAQLMFVLGCGNSSLSHPNWEQNLSLALKLQYLLEQQNPGICRPISLRPQRFNQDLSPGALLIEVGSAGNTRPEALLAADCLAEAILQLKDG